MNVLFRREGDILRQDIAQGPYEEYKLEPATIITNEVDPHQQRSRCRVEEEEIGISQIMRSTQG